MFDFDGHGYFVWQCWTLPYFDDPEKFKTEIVGKGSIKHLWVKLNDGVWEYHKTSIDQFKGLCDHAKIPMLGWGFSYGAYPRDEAKVAAALCLKYGITDYAWDVESYWKGKPDSTAALFMDEFKTRAPNVRLWLCTYRYPTYHRELPWRSMMAGCDGYLPQIYWQESHNPDEQFHRSLTEYRDLEKAYGITTPKPYVGAGAAYSEHEWTPTTAEQALFTKTAKDASQTFPGLYPVLLWWELNHSINNNMLVEIGKMPLGYETPPPPPPPPQDDEYKRGWDAALDRVSAFVKGL